MKKVAAFLIVIMVLTVSLCFTSFGEETPVTAAPTSTAVPEGLVLDSSIVFAILIFAAAIGVGAGYWYARRR